MEEGVFRGKMLPSNGKQWQIISCFNWRPFHVILTEFASFCFAFLENLRISFLRWYFLFFAIFLDS